MRCAQEENGANRDWDVLIIAGASGCGKTSVARLLARFYGVDIVAVDDFQVLLNAMTTPQTLAPLHYWDTHPNWANEAIEATVGQLIDVGKALMPGLAAVINNHLQEKTPMILEGDFILPQLCATFKNSPVKSLCIYEGEKQQIIENYRRREGSVQEHRATVSCAYGKWLKSQCEQYHLPVIASRPWESVLQRSIAAL